MFQSILGALILYLPSLNIFFSSDDWFHLRITQIDNWHQFINFFSFFPNSQSASFYRPLSTQVFFFVFQKLFGLNAIAYHIFVLICFGYSIYLVYKFSLLLFKREGLASISAIIYGISVTNFTRIYFLSAFQEICLVIFSILCLINFKKSGVKSLIFFVLALLSKETAVVIPILLFILYYPEIMKSLIKYLSFFIVLLPYLYFRFAIFGLTSGDSYLWNFSFIKALNTLLWYVLWSFGAPELLVDYIGSGLMPIARFFTDLSVWWPIIVFPLLTIVSLTLILFIKKIRSITKLFPYVLFFLIPLLPVIFLPQHKFPLELGLSMIGFSICVAYILPDSKLFRNIFLGLFVSYNIAMTVLTYPRHYSVSRAQISHKVYEYFTKNYIKYPEHTYFEFVNDSDQQNIQWGQSLQISQALSGSDFFKVLYRNPEIKVYYQDINEDRPQSDAKPVYISTKQFLIQ